MASSCIDSCLKQNKLVQFLGKNCKHPGMSRNLMFLKTVLFEVSVSSEKKNDGETEMKYKKKVAGRILR